MAAQAQPLLVATQLCHCLCSCSESRTGPFEGWRVKIMCLAPRNSTQAPGPWLELKAKVLFLSQFPGKKEIALCQTVNSYFQLAPSEMRSG